MPKPPLSIVNPTATTPDPPRPLGKYGQNLWQRVHAEYHVDDAQGVELLALACEQLDNVAAMQAQIDADGLTISNRTGGYRDHPLLKHALQGRAFIAKTLTKLGIDPGLRPGPGRPPGRGA